MTQHRAGRLPRRLVALAATATAVAATFVSPSARADEHEDVARLLVERIAPAVVPIRVVVAIKISMQGQSMEIPEQSQSMQGTIIDPSGLVMAGTEEPLIKALEASTTGMQISISLRAFHVQLHGEATERDAVLVAKDGAIGLGYLQIVGPGGEPPSGLPSVDVGEAGALTVGAELYGVERMGKAFDYAPQVERAFICGQYEQPRPMAALSGEFAEHGLPVYDAKARLAGVYVVQSSGDAGTSLSSVFSGMSGGVLANDVVRASVARAKKLVPAALAKAKAGGEKGATPEKPDAKPPTPPDAKPGEKPDEKPDGKPGDKPGDKPDKPGETKPPAPAEPTPAR